MLMKGLQLIRLSVALAVECNPMWLSLGLEQPPIRAGAVREQIWDVRGWVVAVLLGFFFGACVFSFFFFGFPKRRRKEGEKRRGEERGGEIKQTTKQPNNQTTRITPLHKAAAAQRSRSHFLAAFCQRDFSESWCLGPPGSPESPLLSLSPPHSLESVCVCVCVRAFLF